MLSHRASMRALLIHGPLYNDPHFKKRGMSFLGTYARAAVLSSLLRNSARQSCLQPGSQGVLAAEMPAPQ